MRLRDRGRLPPDPAAARFAGDLQLWIAARVVRAGGVVAYATEGVFGLGCDPWNEAAVRRLLALKGRDRGRGLILIAAGAAQIEALVHWPEAGARARILASWPGPVTWVLSAAEGAPAALTRADGSLAVRVPGHAQARALCRRAGPLVSTSANPSARPAARGALAVRRYFGAALDYLLPGATGGLSGPSAIRDGRSGALLRAPPARGGGGG